MTDMKDKFRMMFAENAEHRGSDESHLPIKGDIRIHFEGNPVVREWEEAPSDVLSILGGFVRASISADFDLGGTRITHENVTMMFSKEPLDVPADKRQKLCIDLDLTDFKEVWDACSDSVDVIRNPDDLINSSTFQLQCLLSGIEKVESRNMVADLTKFRNLAIKKSQGPAQQSLDLQQG